MSSSLDKILVVDDDDDAREFLASCVSNFDYEVLQASSGREAILIAATAHPDVIVLDVVMPGMDGYQVCQELKQQAETQDIPIILVTVLRKLSDALRGFEVGAHDFISKPYNQAELNARIRSALHVKKLQDLLKSRNSALKDLLKLLQVDITDPLTGVLGRTTLLLHNQLAEDVREDLKTIESMADRIAQLMKHLDNDIKTL